MKKKLLLISFMFIFQTIFAQKLHFMAGKNLTTYNYTTSKGTNNFKLESRTGNNYELGYEHSINPNFTYIVSFTLNEFNAFTRNQLTNYSWNTTYLGLKNAASYTLLKTKNNLEFSVKAGFSLLSITEGTEEINGIIYDIKRLSEFDGLFVQPLIGLDLRYPISEKCILSVGYNSSNAFKLSHATDEKLTFINNQIQLGIHIPL